MAGFPERILVVDDDPVMLELQELALLRAGDITIQCCNSCDSAMSAMQGFTPDLILLDLVMPGKDGTDAVREFRTLPAIANSPIIFVTGRHQVTMQEEYRQLGVVGVIHKPFKPSDYIMTIQKLWQAHRFGTAE